MYLAYPAVFGNLVSAIMDGASPVLGALTKQTPDNNITNRFGVSTDYIIYRTNSLDAFTNNDVAFA
jgi:hypothetical protein